MGQPFFFGGGVSKLVVYMKSRHLETYVGTNDVGKGLHIVHAGNIRLNAAKIGNNFRVYQGVTIGSGKGKGVPIIGDNVICYTNCVVYGEIFIGSGSRIGATAFVNRYLPENSVVINECITKIRRKDS